MAFLIEEAIALHNGYIFRCKHPYLRNYSSWTQFMDKHQDSIIGQVDRLFSKGFKSINFQEALSKRSLFYKLDQTYLIGRIEDSKNMQFPRVQILSDSYDLYAENTSHRANIINHLYTGISRAQYELILPCELMGRMSDYMKSTHIKNVASELVT